MLPSPSEDARRLSRNRRVSDVAGIGDIASPKARAGSPQMTQCGDLADAIRRPVLRAVRGNPGASLRTESQDLDDRCGWSERAFSTQAVERHHVWQGRFPMRRQLGERSDQETARSPETTKTQALAVICGLCESVRCGDALPLDEGVSRASLERALDDAERFVNAWPEAPVAEPDVGLVGDGEVNFLWKHNGAHVDLGFFGDGTYSYFAKDSQGNRYPGDDVPAERGLVQSLLEILVEQA